MKRLLLLVLCALAFPLSASHIVGGEFELIHISGSLYRVNLIYYFDKINGLKNPDGSQSLPEDIDPTLTAHIYRKSDNMLIRSVVLLFSEKIKVNYTQLECSDEGLKTERLLYTTMISMTADTYNDPQGYYIAWQRCCRNYTIDNIFSEVPTPGQINDPNAAGQTFYLEFPPVVKDGQPFINSSPRLFPPLSDYACPDRLYYVDFAGIDDDNDSIVYSLTTPFNTTTTEAYPPAAPAPYPEIRWKPGYSLERTVLGSPDLKISTEGLLTVKPNQIGLFVFAVKVEEFRNKVKIGETRRDFQMLVSDGCPRAVAPVIVGKKLTDASYTDATTIDVQFAASTPDVDRAITVRVTDDDSKEPLDNFREVVRIRLIPLNFKTSDLSDINLSVTSALLQNGSSKEFKISFPKCPYFEGGPYQIGVIALDDACSLPLLDTLRVNVTVEPPPNERAKFVTPGSDVFFSQVNEGDLVSYDFEAHDAESDELTFFALPLGFDLSAAGMKVVSTENGNGVLKGKVEWNADCREFLFNTRTDFQIKLLVDDGDVCNFNEPDTVTFNLKVKLPGNADPITDTNLTSDPFEIDVSQEMVVNTDMSFNVTATEADGDLMVLRMVGKDFSPSQYGMSFSRQTGRTQLQSQFDWKLRCDKIDVSKKDQFHLQFLAVDSTNKCRVRKADTVNVIVNVLPPPNHPPQLVVASLNERLPFSNNKIVAYLGQPINLELTGFDADDFPEKDPLEIKLVSTAGDYDPTGFTFSPATGTSGVSTAFQWTPDCSIFKNEDFENDYSFTFQVSDQRCGLSEKDEVTIDIKMKDYEAGVLFDDPPNVFTPNGDGFNDSFAMEKRDGEGNLVNIIPPDNCTGSFVMVQIFNRWGKLVFESTDREFRWFGKNEPAGVYYYYLKFTNKEYKGSVSLQF